MTAIDIILSERSQMKIVCTAWFFSFQGQEQEKVIIVVEVKIWLL